MNDAAPARVPAIRLKPDRDASLRKGHPWVFSGAVSRADKRLKPGDTALVEASDGTALGLGFYHYSGDIAFRLVTRDVTATLDREFWKARIDRAVSLREVVIGPGTDAFRLVNAEGDGFPGWVVDRYAGTLVVSAGTAGIERWRDVLLELLVERLRPETVVERSEGRSRAREGLADRSGVVYGATPAGPVRVRENGLAFDVDVLGGQKTGFFLDQRPNREMLRALAGSRRVLNAFAYTGAFSVYAAAGGAARVVTLDASAQACGLASRNLSLNGYAGEAFPVVDADVFEYLRRTEERFDAVVLDPPAFAKTRADLERAARGYKDVNLQAFRRLDPGGLCLTFSCSNHLDEILFRKIVLGAAQDAGRTAQVLAVLGPGLDHPVLLGHPEGHYLKGLLLKVN